MRVRSREHTVPKDDGWVLIEVVVASAVLFFVVTALLGLLGASTSMSVQAKAHVLAVNRADSLVERVRALRYTDVTQPNLSALAVASSGTENGVALTVSAAVTPMWFAGQDQSVNPPAYKHITVAVTAQGPIGSPYTFSTGTYVRPGLDGASDMSTSTPGADSPVPKPSVWLIANTPQSGAVYGSRTMGLEARAGGSSVTLSLLQMTAAGSIVLEKRTTASQDSTQGVWDTTQWPDGVTEMRAQAKDTRSQLGDLAWALYIDNIRADAPSAPTLSAVTGNSSVSFEAVDTSYTADPALSYRVTWDKQGSASQETIQAATMLSNRVTVTHATSSFSRYRVSIGARGPRAHFENYTPSESSASTSEWYVSRPSMSGSTVSVVDAGRLTAPAILSLSLKCDTPQFAEDYWSVTRYIWQSSYGTSGTWSNLDTTTASAYVNPSWTAPSVGKYADLGVRFRCLVRVTPLWDSRLSVPSCVQPFSGTTPGTPDWTRWLSPPTALPVEWTRWLL